MGILSSSQGSCIVALMDEKAMITVETEEEGVKRCKPLQVICKRRMKMKKRKKKRRRKRRRGS